MPFDSHLFLKNFEKLSQGTKLALPFNAFCKNLYTNQDFLCVFILFLVINYNPIARTKYKTTME